MSTNIQFFVFGAKSHRMLSHQLTLASYIHELYESSTQRKTYANYRLIMTDKCYKRHYWEEVQFQRRPVQVQLAKVRASRHWNATAAWKDSCQSKLMALTPQVGGLKQILTVSIPALVLVSDRIKFNIQHPWKQGFTRLNRVSRKLAWKLRCYTMFWLRDL